VPLLPFFHVEENFVPSDLGHLPEPPRQAPLTSQDDAPAEQSVDVDPYAFEVGAADSPQEELPLLEGEPLAADDEPTPPNSEDMQLLSLAGGSFAAALTPPPGRSEDGGEAAMGALPPAPWDLASGKSDEQWSVKDGAPPPFQGGPPPLQGGPPKLKLPPPVPKKGSVDEIALALGLPQLEDRPPQAPPPALLVSQSTGEDEPMPKSSKKTLFVIGGSALLITGIIVLLVLRTATKELEKPIEPTSQPEIAAASLPVKPTATKVEEGVKADPAKRAQAIELYSKGNKLYLVKKFKEAESEYKKALEADASFALAYRGLGVTYASQEKNQKAIESYKSYLKLAPDAKDGKLVRQIIKEAESNK